MFDAAPSDTRQQVLSNVRDHASSDSDGAAWIDSDDERLRVSLASNTRLRKLRISESEDIISGTEYAKRLRQQYERLHPPPKWAQQLRAQQSSRTRRKLDKDGSDSADDSDAMSEDEDNLLAKPLAKLLRDAESLMPPVSAGKSRKLRPEVIDMHRLKDVGSALKVGHLSLMAVFCHVVLTTLSSLPSHLSRFTLNIRSFSPPVLRV